MDGGGTNGGRECGQWARLSEGVISPCAGASVEGNLEIMYKLQADIMTMKNDIFTYLYQLKNEIYISVIYTDETHSVGNITMFIA